MIDELIRKRANGLGFQTIALDLKIARNTVKSRLKEIGAYEIPDAQRLLLAGNTASLLKVFTPHWSDKVSWPQALSDIQGGTPIKEYWEYHLVSSLEEDLRHVPYETFWREFRRRHPSLDIYYHKTHEPGQRCEVDYKGDTPGLGYIDKISGEFIECRFFGMVLCNSRMFFPYATLDEKQGSWLAGIRNGFEYFNGVTATLVVDNTRCAVNEADWFDPDVNQEFFNFCNHYQTAMIAARPKRPTDKNLIEVHLGVFWRWVRRRIRQQQFFSVGELNRYLEEAANEFNQRYQKKYGSSRRDRFEDQERKTLKPLPAHSYEAGEWRKAKLHDDCHIQFKYNYYSAPYQHRGKELDVRITVAHVEIFYQQERIAIHSRRPDSQRGNYSTDKKHLPERFQAMEEMTVSRQIMEARKLGPNTEKIVTNLLTDVSHPLMFLRRTMGILRLKSSYGASRLERSCEVLIQHGSLKPRVKDIEKMLKSPNLENKPKAIPIERKQNPHLRGQMSFTTEGENNYASVESDGSVSDGVISKRNPGEFKSQDH
jgi:transposase